MKPALSWGTAVRIAGRELRAGRTKFLFVLLSVAVGVAALTGVRGFSDSFQKALLLQARSLMAGDLSARMFRQATPQELQQLNALRAEGVQRTVETDMVSMATTSAHPVPLLVSLKAVNPQKYPFYGTVVLQPAGQLRQVLTNQTVVVDEELLVRMQAKIGDQLKIGGRWFRIAATIAKEPDRLMEGIGLGPRVMMTRAAMEETGLLMPGSRATERYVFKLADKQSVAAVRAKVEKILPDAEVADYRQTSPAITHGLDHATGLLSLICLVAMVLGAIGVGMAMRAHLQQRIEILAIMKSIGARSSDILRIYLLQTVLLGTAGALIGIALGLGVEYALPAALGSLLPLRPALELPAGPVLEALGTGILTTVLFCLPPLLDVRKVRPGLVLRRTVEGGESGSWLRWVKEQRLQLAAIAVIVAALGGIAAALADSWLIGRWFALCLAGVLAVILGMAAGVLRGLRAFLARTRLHLHSVLRHGLANLYRPGNQSAAVMAALGAGVMLILSVFLMQRSIVESLHADVKPNTPNVFLVDMSTGELPGIEALLKKQAGVKSGLETIPVVAGRLDSIDGTPVSELRKKHYPKWLLRSATLSWASAPPAGTKVTAGKWWSKGSNANDLAVVEEVAKRLHMKVGTPVTFIVGETRIAVKVGAIYKTVGQHAFRRSEFVLPHALLENQPVVWYGDIHAEAFAIPDIERALFAAYPTVTVVNIADILSTIQGVVDQITIVIRFLAGFSILAGLIILASSVASTRFRRMREVVVLKTLGATRRRIATVFSVEFVVLGLLAGAVGVLFANLLTRILLHRMDVTFHSDTAGSAAAVVATAVLAVVTGWIASFRILGQKPLEVLREE